VRPDSARLSSVPQCVIRQKISSMSNPPTPTESHPNKQKENDALETHPRIAEQRSISPASTARIKVKNRRKRYLDTHPTYLSSPSLELAGPVLVATITLRIAPADQLKRSPRLRPPDPPLPNPSRARSRRPPKRLFGHIRSGSMAVRS